MQQKLGLNFRGYGDLRKAKPKNKIFIEKKCFKKGHKKKRRAP
jgi:hypothetical protein